MQNLGLIGDSDTRTLNKARFRFGKIQTGIYLQSKLDKSGNTYTVPVLLKLIGYDTKLLNQSLDSLLTRHRILRIKPISAEEFEIIPKDKIIPVIMSLNESEVSDYLESAANKVFDIDKDILITPQIVVIENSKADSLNYVILNLTHHHLLTDAYSIDMIIGEVINGYHQLKLTGFIPDLPVTLDYIDYIPYQEYLVASDEYMQVCNILANRLSQVSYLHIPTKKADNGYENFGEQFNLTISQEIITKLNELALDCKVSLYTILLTLLYHVLNQFNQNHEELFTIGITVSNRKPEFNHALGPFISFLPLIFDYSKTESILENFLRVHQELTLLTEHSDINLTQITQVMPASVRNVAIIDSQESKALIQVMFTMHNFEQSGQDVTWISLKRNVEKFGISIIAKQREEGLVLEVSYMLDKYSKEIIEKIFGCYLEALNDVNSCQLDESISNLRLITDEDYQKLVINWNETDEDYELNKTIHG
ncbi:MAG: hypothetical protein QG673_585, partial [Pseudomonadota bacterium]|nr:hypothetical protein [Pseudomonadota bacterium]